MNCPSCGRAYRQVLELKDVQSVGLALKGACRNCGTRFGINGLWRKSGESELLPEAWSTEKKHSERVKRFRKKKQSER